MFETRPPLARNGGFVVYYPVASGAHPGGRGHSFWESTMISLRWTAGCILSVALIVGCQPAHKEPETTAAVVPASPEQTAAAKERESAKGDRLVGEVDAAKDG